MAKKSGRHSQQANDFLEPSVPTIDSVTDVGTSRAYNDGAVDVAFTLPAGSYAATSYTVLSSGSQTATGSSSPIRVTGLSSGTSYTFQVKATKMLKDWFTLDISELPAGLYLIRIAEQGCYGVARLVKL
mgnify:CR=1 FL=1